MTAFTSNELTPLPIFRKPYLKNVSFWWSIAIVMLFYHELPICQLEAVYDQLTLLGPGMTGQEAFINLGSKEYS